MRSYREDSHDLATKEVMVSNFKEINKVSDIFINYWVDVRENHEVYMHDIIDLMEYMYDNPDGYEIDYRIGKQVESNGKN